MNLYKTLATLSIGSALSFASFGDQYGDALEASMQAENDDTMQKKKKEDALRERIHAIQQNMHKEISKIAKACDLIKLRYSDDLGERELTISKNNKNRIAQLLKFVVYRKPVVDLELFESPIYSLQLEIISKTGEAYSFRINSEGEIEEYVAIDLAEDKKNSLKEILKPYIDRILATQNTSE